jgi:hypothetical protein
VKVVVTANWKERLLPNTHAYADFKQFDVKTSQRIDRPNDAGKTPESTTDP